MTLIVRTLTIGLLVCIGKREELMYSRWGLLSYQAFVNIQYRSAFSNTQGKQNFVGESVTTMDYVHVSYFEGKRVLSRNRESKLVFVVYNCLNVLKRPHVKWMC